MNSVERGMYRSIIMTGRGRTAGKSREVSRQKENEIMEEFGAI